MFCLDINSLRGGIILPRLGRQESNTKHYHVMTRGINKDAIFKNKLDKEKLIKVIKKKINEIECKIYAYCVMDNHLHLLLECDVGDLSLLMQKINISYAAYYNLKNNRIGPVFQDRFKSEIIFDEKYFYGVIRYIHNNPVQANIVIKPEEYIWSSIREYIYNESNIIHKDAKKMIKENFKTISSFSKFHEIQDKQDYLEIAEEVQLRKIELGREIIDNYLEQIESEALVNTEDKEQVIIKLLETEKFSYRKIAELVGASVHMVYVTNKKTRP